MNRLAAISRGDYAKVSRLRGRLLRAARQWFDERDFLEVTIPPFEASPVSPLTFAESQIALNGDRLFLEAYAAAHDRVYSIRRRWKNGDPVSHGTLIEFESCNESYENLAENMERLVKELYEAAWEVCPNDALVRYVTRPLLRLTYGDSPARLQKESFPGESKNRIDSEAGDSLRPTGIENLVMVDGRPSNPPDKQGARWFDLLLPASGVSAGGIFRQATPPGDEWLYPGRFAGGVIYLEAVMQSVIAAEEGPVGLAEAVQFLD